MHIAQPLHKYLSGEGASKKNQCETLTAFDMLTKACLEAPILSFTDFIKPFLLETDVSKQGLGPLLSHKQSDGQHHSVANASWSLNCS